MRGLVVVGGLAAALAGCQTMEIRGSDGSIPAAAAPDKSRRMDLLPLIELSLDKLTPANSAGAVGAYTRVVATFRPSTDSTSQGGGATSPRRYSDEDRHFIERWLFGSTISKLLALKVTLSSPSVSVTVPLAASTHQSNRSVGEAWTSDFQSDRFVTGYFRIDPSSTLSIQATLSASSAVEGEVTGAVVGVLRQAAELVAPQSSIVTTLNADRLKSASDFVDNSISKLFGRSLTERAASDFPVDVWTSGPIATITAQFPTGRNIANDEVAPIGEWELRLATPILSVFTGQPACVAGPPPRCHGDEVARQQVSQEFQTLTPATVLDFEVAEGVTLGAALKADAAVGAALVAANGASEANRQATGRALCSAISGKVAAIGLNRFDIAATIWAVSGSELVTVEAGVALGAARGCPAATLAADILQPHFSDAERQDDLAPAAQVTDLEGLVARIRQVRGAVN